MSIKSKLPRDVFAMSNGELIKWVEKLSSKVENQANQLATLGKGQSKRSVAAENILLKRQLNELQHYITITKSKVKLVEHYETLVAEYRSEIKELKEEIETLKN